MAKRTPDHTPEKQSALSKNVLPNTEKADLLLEYAQIGFTVFPLKEDRTPAKKGWRDTPYTNEPDAKEFPHGFGLGLEAQDFVLDYDPRRDAEKGKQLRELWGKLALPKADTLIVRTGRGGVHVYFHKPEDVPVKSVVPGYPAIEIKSVGRYVVGPGSPHPDSKNKIAYWIERGAVNQIAEVPAALLEYCTAQEREISTNDFNADDEFTKRRFIQYCKDVDPGGNAYVTCCTGRGFGLSAESIFDIMQEHYSPRCSPAQDVDELRTKITNAFLYARNSQGNDHPNADFGEPEVGKGEDLTEIARKSVNPASGLSWDWAPGGKFKLNPTLKNGMNFMRMAQFRPMVVVDGRLIGDMGKELAPNEVHGMLRYNLHSSKIEFIKPAPWHSEDFCSSEWTATDTLLLKNWFGEKRPLTASKELFMEVAQVAALDNRYHPIKDFIRGTVWDGEPRIDEWLSTYCRTHNNEYTREIGKNALIGAVARIFQPGCKHDEMIILEGDEGIFKSTVIDVLGGEFGRSVKVDPSTQQGYVRTVSSMMGAWIIEIAEMEAIRRSDVEALKQFISERKDTVRLAYEQFDRTIPRQSIFIGTINPKEAGYLKNVPGNRRFQPVRCHSHIDIDGLKRDREQLFAEAYHRFQAGEIHHIADPVLVAVARREQQSRVETDAWVDIIIEWVNAHGDKIDDDEGVKLDYIAAAALNLSPNQLNRVERVRLGEALRSAGYYSKPVNSVRRWFKIKTVDFI